MKSISQQISEAVSMIEGADFEIEVGGSMTVDGTPYTVDDYDEDSGTIYLTDEDGNSIEVTVDDLDAEVEMETDESAENEVEEEYETVVAVSDGQVEVASQALSAFGLTIDKYGDLVVKGDKDKIKKALDKAGVEGYQISEAGPRMVKAGKKVVDGKVVKVKAHRTKKMSQKQIMAIRKAAKKRKGKKVKASTLRKRRMSMKKRSRL